MFSCSTSNNDVETSSQSLKIENDLKFYNEGLEGYSSSGMPKKGKFWKVLGVIAADFAGGAAGSLLSPAIGVVIAGAASGAAASAAPGGGNDPINTNFNVEYNVPEGFDDSDIGEQHNDILANVFMGDTPIEDYLVQNYGDQTVQQYYSSDVQSMNDLVIGSTVNYVEMNYDYSFLFSTYKDNGLISENTEMVMSLFTQAFFQAASDDEISQILNYYSQTVLQSDELTQSDKRSIFSAFSVARSSSNYWNNLEN
ncbi:hypothetical protein DVK85_06445 [Flavobacterium arcticum]|uniref:Uncharacterized protein n=1 Tax=Flavobacterium arcticum TaxID=1784713 RepID=A0A345HBD9_9FLAO|nr:hypothetical protein [Flavobacterium arcticum]AXG73899.1 hypothetical protein DVK85_06445 [Flavobacterium arcticum]KAF2508875.1 hypothetical protein E0W72_09930 [Flavobacterium arcticum]